MAEPIALIFDMDGVIIDSTQAHVAAWQQYLAEHGIEVPDLAARMLGKHNDEIVKEFFAGVEMTREQMAAHGARKEALYRRRIEPGFKDLLVPGVTDFIRRHAALPLGVASNAEPANVEFVLEMAGLRGCFRALVNGHDVERPKPHPDIYLKAAELLGVEPARCIVFEDSETGVEAARRARMRIVGVLTTLDGFDKVNLVIRDFLDPNLEPWLSAALNG